MASSPLAIPVKLDAFIFNPDTCNGTEINQAKISPLTQPNYSYLQIKNFMLQNDVLRPIELHAAAPADRNSRITDLATGKTRQERLGVYLHWMIPRPYRTGAAATGQESNQSRAQRGLFTSNVASDKEDLATPLFPETPNRWLVIRKIIGNVEPAEAEASLDPVTAWVIESDWMRSIDEMDDTDGTKYDLQVDVSPYLQTGSTDEPTINEQAEVFIGGRIKAKEWNESTSQAKKRISLGVLNSSNQLFPDYMPHNSNVFSMLDSFEYAPSKYATRAVADYYVLGWHVNPDDDLMHLSDDSATTRGDRLQALSTALNKSDGPVPDEVDEWLKSTKSGRVLCHGAMYGVRWSMKWDENNKPRVIADEVADQLHMKTPISVGTTPLDSLLSYVAAHQNGPIEELLNNLSALLQAQSESIENRRAGADEVQNYNFAKFAGGSRYVFQIDPKNPAAPPSDDAAALLKKLNESQALYDASARQLSRVQWKHFALWWRYVTDTERDHSAAKRQYKKEVEDLNWDWHRLNAALNSQTNAIQTAKDDIQHKLKLELKEAVAPVFSQQRDPTIFVGGVEAGWPTDYLEKLLVRLYSQIEKHAPPPPDEEADYGLQCIPDALQDMAKSLIGEFLHYEKERPVEEASGVVTCKCKSCQCACALSKKFLVKEETKEEEDEDQEEETDKNVFPPLYHDEDGRDLWKNTQPWFPLFMEWEAEYYHIDYDKWDMEERGTRSTQDKKFRYTVKQDDKPLWESANDDRRTISGRILLLPQPVFSLVGQVERLFTTVPEDQLDPILPKDEREQVLKELKKLPFVSAPLDGFANHLLTLADGSHLKPNVRYPGQKPVPMKDAYEDSVAIGLGAVELERMGVETDLTPYGSLVRVGTVPYSVFKPAAHGQFKLTKLNIIDKFGQAAAAIDPKRRHEGPPPIYPCISEYYEPQIYEKNGYPNVVEKPKNKGDCQFMQIPPSINQPARLNMNFVKLDHHDDEYHWRPITEWENPIWGWVLVNYVDFGIQFFLHDGTFYREVRLAAPNNPNKGTQATDKWLPFKPPVDPQEIRQLDHLIEQFSGEGGRDYLNGFMDMATQATRNASTVPGAYAQCVNSLIGRPLALVNAGISLELSADARTNQSTLGDQPSKRPPYTLLPDPHPDTKQYEFSIKLGDAARPHDGLVAYFRARDSPLPEDELKLDQLFTSFKPASPHDKSDKIKPIDTETFLRLKPFWLNPNDYSAQKGPQAKEVEEVEEEDEESKYTPQEKFTIDHNKKLTVVGLLMDPFTPVNAYSSILPVEPLALSTWTWESALKNMTAFFHFGPLMVEKDVPVYNPERILLPNYDLEKLKEQKIEVKLPSLAVADWSWLQPYLDPESTRQSSDDDEEVTDEVYMALRLGKIDPVPQFAPGPLTALEGFLQMVHPITAPDVEGDKKQAR
ncbi:hypothetical protein BBK36DRAFT_1179717 [Trichoderma citrinoviride]|uniref:Uncharacterized protein n=1 Tax=Trichoderma citrinoviride TaxID=58853 RepID=A0A2T4B5C1_9HYPO|nr:hypothetical protein BBK36DRAFT_1179717 [Trichoderma citrinoviride]PTB64500.1 hypothetical protein BBK36DRAFT_1179717 [Trichoderma citrinoviride]